MLMRFLQGYLMDFHPVQIKFEMNTDTTKTKQSIHTRVGTVSALGATLAMALVLAACQPADKHDHSHDGADGATHEHTHEEAHTHEEPTVTTTTSDTGEAVAEQQALLKVEGAWVRAAVEGQSGTGAFMQITPNQDLELVGFDTAEAEVNEVHEMKMDGDIMKMSAIPSLALPGGKTTELKPGSYHLMMMKLKQPLLEGQKVQLNLTVKDKDAVVSTFPVQAEVKTGKPMAHDHGHDHEMEHGEAHHDHHDDGHGEAHTHE